VSQECACLREPAVKKRGYASEAPGEQQLDVHALTT
jgi:hypothetical protein